MGMGQDIKQVSTTSFFKDSSPSYYFHRPLIEQEPFTKNKSEFITGDTSESRCLTVGVVHDT